MAAFWDVALCNLIEVFRTFGRAYYLHHQGQLRCLVPEYPYIVCLPVTHEG